MTFVVGLTGGIGSGKSSAATLFQELGIEVIDADAIAHKLTAPNGKAIPAIRQLFSSAFIDDNNALDRDKMRSLIFSDSQAKNKLESILHPLVRGEMDQRLVKSKGAYLIAVIPLLLESKVWLDKVQRILVIDAPESLQISRVMSRSNLSEQEVRAIMATQISRKERLKQADDVIDNSGSLKALRHQIKELHSCYLALAKNTEKN